MQELNVAKFRLYDSGMLKSRKSESQQADTEPEQPIALDDAMTEGMEMRMNLSELGINHSGWDLSALTTIWAQ
jgi:hypothetical protein